MGSKPTRHTINPADNLNNNRAVDGFGIAPSQQFSRRLLSELRILRENADVQSYFRFESSGQYEGKFCIDGYLLPQSEPYRNGAFKVRITLTTYFPFQSPELQLLTPIYHPAVNEDMSRPEFCCKCCSFEDHRPTSRICDFIRSYVDVIDQPGRFCVCCDYNREARILYRENRTLYKARASEMVTRYAYPRQINS
jgi:ubiquitin-protein ligase